MNIKCLYDSISTTAPCQSLALIYDNSLPEATNAGLVFIRNNNVKSSITFWDTGIYLQNNNVGQAASLSLTDETPTNAGARFESRVSGKPATNNNEFVTKAQLDAIGSDTLQSVIDRGNTADANVVLRSPAGQGDNAIALLSNYTASGFLLQGYTRDESTPKNLIMQAVGGNVGIGTTTIDSAFKLTVDGGIKTRGNTIDAENSSGFVVNAAPGTDRGIRALSNGFRRWFISAANADQENGENTGSNLSIFRYKDDGSFNSLAFQIDRTDGRSYFYNTVTATQATVDTELATLGQVKALAGGGSGNRIIKAFNVQGLGSDYYFTDQDFEGIKLVVAYDDSNPGFVLYGWNNKQTGLLFITQNVYNSEGNENDIENRGGAVSAGGTMIFSGIKRSDSDRNQVRVFLQTSTADDSYVWTVRVDMLENSRWIVESQIEKVGFDA